MVTGEEKGKVNSLLDWNESALCLGLFFADAAIRLDNYVYSTRKSRNLGPFLQHKGGNKVSVESV